MRYILSKEFTKISETSGTVQNTSPSCKLELSNKNEPNTGIFIYPLQQCSFRNMQVYLRCVDGWAAANVVTFNLNNSSIEGEIDDETADLINDIWDNASASSAVI